MKVTFWGTRGSFAKPGPQTVRYGGNTSCVEIVSDSGTRIVVDCGTGAHELGQSIAREGKPVRGYMLISHTHWDHIQGIPFFAPFFIPGHEWDIYAPQGFGESLRETLAGQMEYTYFPVTPEAFGATLRYNNLAEGHLQVGDVSIWTHYLNHPALTIGFRIEVDGACVVYSCDHEPHSRQLAGGTGAILGQDLLHAQFLEGADLVIHDAQYVAAEYAAKAGWGHSTAEYAVQIASFAKVRRLALTSHDPTRTDDQVDAVIAQLHATLGENPPIDVFAAAEGMVIELRGSRQHAVVDASATDAVLQGHARGTATLLLASLDDGLADRIAQAIAHEPVKMLRARSASEAVTRFAVDRPAMVMIDDALEGVTGLELADRIGAASSDLPVLIISTAPSPTDVPLKSSIDWLQSPFSIEYARSRIRTWIMRTGLQWARAELPSNEQERLASLHRLGILDSGSDESLDRSTRIAAALFDAPLAIVSIVDADRQWFKSSFGTDVRVTARDMSFCAHAIAADDMLVVPDTQKDQRFSGHPQVSGDPHIRFYAGAPLRDEGGLCLGTLCVLDFKPRALSEDALAHLRDLARLIEEELRRGTFSIAQAAESPVQT